MSNYKELKEKYDSLCRERDKAEAKKETYLEELKKLGCESVEEAEEKIKEMESSISKLETKRDSLIEKLKGALNDLD